MGPLSLRLYPASLFDPFAMMDDIFIAFLQAAAVSDLYPAQHRPFGLDAEYRPVRSDLKKRRIGNLQDIFLLLHDEARLHAIAVSQRSPLRECHRLDPAHLRFQYTTACPVLSAYKCGTSSQHGSRPFGPGACACLGKARMPAVTCLALLEDQGRADSSSPQGSSGWQGRRRAAKQRASRPVSRILCPAQAGRRSFLWARNCFLALATYPRVYPAALTGRGCGAGHSCSPIWSCSVWGFPCPGRRRPGGALLH